MTMHHQYRLGARALFTLAATVLITMAFATVAPAQVSRTPFQQYLFTNCPVNENCTVDFRTVPPASRLEISNVSCFVEILGPTTSTALVRAAQLLVIRSNGSIGTASTLLLEQQHSTFTASNNTRGFAANHAVAVFANAGQHFQAYVDPLGANDRVSFMACHISGTLVRLG
jgi:hypothetical protein